MSSDLQRAFDAMEREQWEDYCEYRRRCGGAGSSQVPPPCPSCSGSGKHLMCANGLWITVRCTRCQGTTGGQTAPPPQGPAR
jgi:DnaJ-class molecular chaperone